MKILKKKYVRYEHRDEKKSVWQPENCFEWHFIITIKSSLRVHKNNNNKIYIRRTEPSFDWW